MQDSLNSLEEEQESTLYDLKDDGNGDDSIYKLPDDSEDDEKSPEEDIDRALTESEEDDAEAWNGETDDSHVSIWKIFFKIMATPVEGWKALKRSKLSVETVCSRCFYPLIALASISEFTALFYEAGSEITGLIVPAIITFITFFFSYFTVLLCGSFLLPKAAAGVLHTYFGKEYVIMNLSTLVLFYIVYRLMPLLGPVIAFLPLWTIYLTCKGVKLFRVPKDKENHTAGMMSFLIVGSPVLWNWVLGEILPSGQL